MNFLTETINQLVMWNHKESDVLFVSDNKNSCTWEAFKAKANFEYNNELGQQKINKELKIIGKNWWLERYQGDRYEQWIYKTYHPPRMPDGEIELLNA